MDDGDRNVIEQATQPVQERRHGEQPGEVHHFVQACPISHDGEDLVAAVFCEFCGLTKTLRWTTKSEAGLGGGTAA